MLGKFHSFEAACSAKWEKQGCPSSLGSSDAHTLVALAEACPILTQWTPLALQTARWEVLVLL